MSTSQSHGIINHPESHRRSDYLYRISIKSLVRNENGEVLVVKETGRDYWDLPGGGMDHSETIKTAIAREMNEEVGLTGDFDYQIIAVDEPAYSENNNLWQLRLIFELKPQNMTFSVGEDGDELAFIDPRQLKDSDSEVERQIYKYNSIAS